MARGTGLRTGELTLVRSTSGVIAADSSTLTDVNFPTAQAIGCTGFDTILVGAEIDGGVSPTVTIEALFRDPEAPDGSRWKRMLLGAKEGVTGLASPAAEDTGALGNNSDLAELRVRGWPMVYLRVKAVANAGSTTAARILAAPGKPRG